MKLPKTEDDAEFESYYKHSIELYPAYLAGDESKAGEVDSRKEFFESMLTQVRFTN